MCLGSFASVVPCFVPNSPPQCSSSMIDPKNPFVMVADAYVRDINPVKHAINQYAHYLHVMTGDAFEETLSYVKQSITNKRFPKIEIPIVKFLRRQENGDRAPDELPLTEYLREVIVNKEILAPTMTTYINSDVYESILAKYIRGNVAKRNKAKKAMFAAEASGDAVTHFFMKNEQRNRKLSNNSISGAHASPSTPLYNQTNHSTLTSNCRMTSGNGNANNEKLLSGNRHYWKPEIVINNIVSITQNTKYDKLQAVIDKYNLKLPTVQEVMDLILYSTDLYWNSRPWEDRIRALVERLSPIQRAAFAYTGDLFHVAKYNNEFMRKFLGQLSAKTFGEVQNPIAQLHSFPEDYVLLAHQICAEEMRGRGKDYKKMETTPELQTLVATTANIHSTIHQYADFIEVVFVSDNVPASVPYFPSSIRRAALTSDTDSTIFTVQEWVSWYFGSVIFTPQAVGLAATMIFLASQAIIHVLARMCINAGVSRKNMWLVAMKNEFFFPVFVPTSVSKHYWALQSCQEGNVLAKMKKEIKGVHLKSSNAPKEINDKAEEMMMFIANTVMQGKTVSLHDLFVQVADIERSILAAIKRGDGRYCRRGEIKPADSYTKPKHQSNYVHHTFWNECFAFKYGVQEEPPYAVIKLSGGLKNATATKEWLDKIDPEVAKRVREFLRKAGKDTLGAFMIPKQVVDVNGVPEEILLAINARKIVTDISKIFYLILGTVGYHGLDRKMTRLLSDVY